MCAGRLRLWSKLTRIVREQRDLHPVVQPEGAEQARDVRLHRRQAHVQLLGDRGIGLPLPDGERDLLFAVGQPASAAAAFRCRADSAVSVASVTWLMSCRMTLGERIGSPAATRRMASTISAGGVRLSRKPLAPARSARSTWSSLSSVVSTMTSIPG